jgi:hypothetical protein
MKAKILLLGLLGLLFFSHRGPSAPSAPGVEIPEELRSKLTHNIGSTFLVFRAKVAAELKETPAQKERLDACLREYLPEATQVLQSGKAEREKFHQRAHEEIAPVLKEVLSEEQRTRLHQLERQRDGLFGPEWNMKELQISQEQRRQFMPAIQETQMKTKALMGEIQNGASADALRPKILQLRLDLETKLEQLLTDPQKQQWKEMRGEPVDLSVLFDGLAGR